MTHKKGKFISFEGGEGSGKSTQSKLLYQYLLSYNIPVIQTREIGGTRVGEEIRKLLLYSELSPMSELFMVMAARYEHLQQLIIPALNEGNWVICDRFIDSTACYQADEVNLTMQDIYNMHEKLMRCKKPDKLVNNDNLSKNYQNIEPIIWPDLTFFIDIPPEIALPRAMKRGDLNKFEEKELYFHEKIYQRFGYLAKKYSQRIIRIRGYQKSKADIQQIIQKEIQRYF